MTDPERISKRSVGLAARLLQAGAEEQPGANGVQRTLAALGVSAAVVSTGSAAAAAVGAAKATAGAGGAGVGFSVAGGAAKAVSATLLVKWIGIGVVSGVGLAGAAAVATQPATSSSVESHAMASARAAIAPANSSTPELPQPSVAEAASSALAVAAPTLVAPPRVVSEPVVVPPALDVGAPLAAEVAFVDRARALLAAGRAEQGLGLLQSYERDFPEARLLPEVLFLRLETYQRLQRDGEARAAAQRLLDGFPQSPHASRARKLLFP